MAKIEVNNLTKRFNDKLVLDNISMKVEDGEVFGLLVLMVQASQRLSI